MKLVEATLYARKDVESTLHRCGSPVKLVHVYLSVRNDLDSKIHQRYTRQCNGLYIPRPRTNYLKKSFVYQGTLIWNSLPESMRILCIQKKL